MNSADLKLAIARRYPAPQYLTLEEVRDATGFEAVRSADALAISMYLSRGLTIDGFEVKVSRADWLKELEQPAKSESWLQFCHRWWLVISDASLVKDGELPPTWGMLVPNKRGKLQVVVQAPDLSPSRLSMERLTALLYAQAKKLTADRDTMRADLWAEIKESDERQDAGWKDKYTALKERVDQVEQACGCRLIGSDYSWERHKPEDIGRAFKMALNPKGEDWDWMRRTIQADLNRAESVLKGLRESAACLAVDEEEENT